MNESKIRKRVSRLFHSSKSGKTGSLFLSILLTPYQSSHKETKYLSKPKPGKCNINFEF